MKHINDIQLEDEVERLILIRIRLELNQYEFAAKIGIHKNHLNAVEKRKRPFTKKLKQAVNEYLSDLNMSKQLMGKEDEK
ncbi:helix-turn-helix domain-containing protein [Desertibacillus haloalkaliphilus]|uniref:helix-turn-helix domain-containing protein n=1 Tax=Desertibacillus haloalkaliphilus TaxID=1328930 RepID=UPI001C2586EC|nr:helix-turn-helix transcriptional regulator [Desertibacillus haloalkaliphilus]MBU8908085.1 helix-turn-helix domain-containing protein [Desertibacillus haloalkaliphilus]